MKIREIFPDSSKDYEIGYQVEYFAYGVSQTPRSKNVVFFVGMPDEETIRSH